jgi:hypothetical protein
MRNFEEFEPVPGEEDCEQLGKDYNFQKAKAEATETIRMLREIVGIPPEGTILKIASNPHDFGDYLSIRYTYNDENEDHCEYLDRLEREWPERWDLEACDNLGIMLKTAERLEN